VGRCAGELSYAGSVVDVPDDLGVDGAAVPAWAIHVPVAHDGPYRALSKFSEA